MQRRLPYCRLLHGVLRFLRLLLFRRLTGPLQPLFSSRTPHLGESTCASGDNTQFYLEEDRPRLPQHRINRKPFDIYRNFIHSLISMFGMTLASFKFEQ